MGEDRSALASVWAVVIPLGWAAAVGCAHTPTVTPLVGDPPRPPSEAQVTRAWEDASEVFARHDAAGAWDGRCGKYCRSFPTRVSA